MLSLARPAVDAHNNSLDFTWTAAQVDAALHAPASQWLFRYDLLANDNSFIRQLTTVLDSGSPSITYDTTQQVKRTLTLTVEDDGSINYAANRIKPFALLKMPDPVPLRGNAAIQFSGSVPQSTTGNSFAYVNFAPQVVTIATGDQLVFDCYLEGPVAESSIDAASTDATSDLRDNSALVDQNGLPIHPATDLSAYAWNKWYHRIFDLSPIAGSTVGPWVLAFEGDAPGTYTSYFQNVLVLNAAGAVKAALFTNNLQMQGTGAGATGGISGYTDLAKSQVDPGCYAQFPLGVFLLSSPTRNVDAAGVVTRQIQGYDLLQVLVSNYCTSRYTVSAGTNYITAVRDALQAAGITTALNLTPTSETLPATRDWALGTAYLTIINDLLSAINYNSLWFDADGVCVAEPYVTPDQRASTYTFAADSASILSPVVQETLDLFSVPNTWVATVSEPDQQVLTATYVNSNAQSPTSTVNRGFTIVQVDQNSTAPNQTQLNQYVANLAYQSSQIYDQVVLSTALAPFGEDRDVYTVQYQSGPMSLRGKFEEIRWTLPLTSGGLHQHTVQQSISV